MGYRNYSDEDKAVALAYLDANKGNVSRTSDHTGVPVSTIVAWRDGVGMSDENDEIRQEKKRDLAAALDEIAWQLVEAMPAKIGKAPLIQVATAIGIAIDKARLLRNEPTEITRDADRALTDEQRVAEIAAIAESARKRAAGQPPADSAETPAEPV